MNDLHPEDDLLVAFALDDLDSSVRDEVATHVQACEICGRIVAQLADALERCRQAVPQGAPAHVLVRLLEAQAAAARRPAPLFRGILRPVRALAVAAVLAVVFLGGFWTGRNSTPEDSRLPTGTPLAVPLPDPPEIAFYPAVATD